MSAEIVFFAVPAGAAILTAVLAVLKEAGAGPVAVAALWTAVIWIHRRAIARAIRHARRAHQRHYHRHAVRHRRGHQAPPREAAPTRALTPGQQLQQAQEVLGTAVRIVPSPVAVTIPDSPFRARSFA